ncbi:MFS transporter [Mangrovihabitans endophyticus]|uniref:MFS transporter n=1 Tax=Mangrovihabitans endophyticus TaxID=1751298 RepID=A0A8J3C5K6_9ACTN|nr:MFS transporter [Mangrovihabitans endophyticus]GGL10437.1 MFS transporter [Mangrovihabitans endophyticus]
MTTAKTTPPADESAPSASGPRWAMVGAGAALIGTCYGLARFAYGLFAPDFQAEFAIGSTLSGVIGAGSYVGYCVAIVASLLITPRYGPRRVAVLAGLTAPLGIATVAVAPSAPVLAAGIVVAGSSTGIASPPMAAAVARWVRQSSRDRAQTIVNAGTGLGVLISGPTALVLLADWRWAWGTFAVIAALVTGWVAWAIPAPSGPNRPEVQPGEPGSGRGMRLVPGTAMLVIASFVMGLGSIAVWTFGRELVDRQAEGNTTISAAVWIALGASGVLGAFGGDLIRRVGLPVAWAVLMVAMGAATALFTLGSAAMLLVLLAAAVFGASYIGLTGCALIWSTRLYPDRTSLGVGLSFFTLAAGQAAGAPVVGALIGAANPTGVFCAWAALSVAGAALRPRRVLPADADRIPGARTPKPPRSPAPR